MARRKKPQIKGSDPSYDHSFERFRPIPNDMPPDVVVPGVPKESETRDSVLTKPVPSVASRSSATTVPPKVKPKSAKKKEPKSTKTAPKPSPAKVPPQDEKKYSGAGERQTTLDAAVKVEQAARMGVLEAKGLKMKDIITVAGRRATERFVLSPKYVPKPDADRLPMKQGYHTSKRLDGDILDAMRKEQDPLGISSDPAMVRGQFELLFWSCLDDVIAELKAKY